MAKQSNDTGILEVTQLFHLNNLIQNLILYSIKGQRNPYMANIFL